MPGFSWQIGDPSTIALTLTVSGVSDLAETPNLIEPGSTISFTAFEYVPQDVTSRHRGAKPRRRCELSGAISLLSPAYLLSVAR